MNKEALQHIQDTAIAARELPGTDVPVTALPHGVSIHNLEQYMEAPASFRAIYCTNSIDDFVRYVHTNPKALCFIDSEEMTARALFDKGSPDYPGHGRHKAGLKLTPTAEFEQLKKVDQSIMNQKQLAEWIEEWRDWVLLLDAENQSIALAAGLANIRSLTINASQSQTHEDRNYGASKSTMKKIDAEAKEGALPWGVKFTCIPFNGLAEKGFFVRFSLVTQNDKPCFSLRVLRMEAAIQEMAEEFKTRVAEKIVPVTEADEATTNDYKIYLGSMS